MDGRLGKGRDATRRDATHSIDVVFASGADMAGVALDLQAGNPGGLGAPIVAVLQL